MANCAYTILKDHSGIDVKSGMCILLLYHWKGSFHLNKMFHRITEYSYVAHDC